MKIPLRLDRAVIEVNGGCNYACQMCPQSTGRGSTWTKRIALDKFESLVEQCTDAGARIINLEGSGEPTVIRNLHEYVAIVRKYNAEPYFLTNGLRFKDDMMRRCIDEGLSRVRFSVIGYNKETYKKWMSKDAFDIVKKNAIETQKYIYETKSDCKLASYHLILDNDNQDYEIEQYKTNFIDVVQSKAEIWKMHNWSGVYDVDYKRKGKKRSCGRPFAPEITIRAGDNTSVAPCCLTLGRDDQANLGSLKDKTVEEVYNSERYQWLRKMHSEERFDEIDFCKDCDFLYEDNEVLVYTSNSNAQINKMAGTNFSLSDYTNIPIQMLE